MDFLRNRKFLLFLIPYLFLYFFTARNALFWDTVQFAADHPSWYYDHNFKYFFLPAESDSGHPPTFGMYLALMWKLMGKSLWVSHTAMLPFLIIIVAQAVKLGENLFPANKRFAAFCTAIVLSEAALLSQCTLVSPDIWVAAFFLYGLNSVLRKSPYHLTLAVILMAMLSMRAMMGAFCLYLFSLSYNRKEAGQTIKGIVLYLFRKVWPFVPGGLLAVSFFVAHYYAKGWAGHPPPSSTWGGGFVIMPFPRILLNVVILFWRIVDIGKILTVLVFLVLCLKWLFRKNILDGSEDRNTLQSLFILVLSLFLITALPLAPYQGLLTHRYFIPLYFSIAVFALYLLFHSQWKRKVLIASLMVLVQLSGNFWTYPQQISQGWDSTLGHLPFYSLRKEFRAYMKQNGIEKNDVATSFTLVQSDSRIDLKGDTLPFRDFETDSTQYVWYCNASNAMNKVVGYYLDNFDVVKQERKGNVEMILFKRKNNTQP